MLTAARQGGNITIKTTDGDYVPISIAPHGPRAMAAGPAAMVSHSGSTDDGLYACDLTRLRRGKKSLLQQHPEGSEQELADVRGNVGK
eukprot:5358714-Amphidinium_carterae.1